MLGRKSKKQKTGLHIIKWIKMKETIGALIKSLVLVSKCYKNCFDPSDKQTY